MDSQLVARFISSFDTGTQPTRAYIYMFTRQMKFRKNENRFFVIDRKNQGHEP